MLETDLVCQNVEFEEKLFIVIEMNVLKYLLFLNKLVLSACGKRHGWVLPFRRHLTVVVFNKFFVANQNLR